MRKRAYRERSGITMVEFAAACVVGLPLIVTVIYATLEANFLFAIRTNVDAAVRRAAQALINDYIKTGTMAAAVSNGNLPNSLGFSVPTGDGHYFIHNSANQFTWNWNTSVDPATITVTVSYPTTGGGTALLVPFPHPDPLKLGNSFRIRSSGTFPVPGFNN